MPGNLSIDLAELQVFVEVTETRSMTKAADRLAITQSAVSQAIRRLESKLAVALFHRDRRPLTPTPAGFLLRTRADRLIHEALLLPSVLRDADANLTPEVRIGLVDTFAGTAGPQLVRMLSNVASRVVVWSGLSTTLGDALLERKVDLIVTTDLLEDVDDLRRFLLWREPFVQVRPKVIRPDLQHADLEHLASELPLIRFSARSHIGIQIERQLRRLGIRAERRIEIDSSDGLIAMVAAGVGWAIATPLCLLQGSRHLTKVTVEPLPRYRMRRSLAMMCRQDEFPRLAGRVAAMSLTTLRDVCLPGVRQIAPWLEREIEIGPKSSL
jgi:DNA-binding transcriptional LysR family regulator